MARNSVSRAVTLTVLMAAGLKTGLAEPAAVPWNKETSSSAFCPAYYQEASGAGGAPLLTLFPMEGPKVTIPGPGELPRNLRLIAISRDGKALYLQVNGPLGPGDAIRKIEFKPIRQSLVRGSEGFGTIWHLTVSSTSGKLFVSGCSKKRGTAECGAFEIDPEAGTSRALHIGTDGGGTLGPVSPDGKRVLSHRGNQLNLLDLETGIAHLLRADLKWGSWSPDGRWIAAISDTGRIVLIDATETTRRRSLGSSGHGPVFWSPDSKFLLRVKSQLRCTLTLYFESLEVLSVESGKRRVIKSSRCEITGGEVGWIDPENVR